jgi:hypothetical protein
MGTVAGREGTGTENQCFGLNRYGFRQNGSVDSGPGRPKWPTKKREKCRNFMSEDIFERLKASARAGTSFLGVAM